MKKFIKNISEKTKNLFSQNKLENIYVKDNLKENVPKNKKSQTINADIYVGLNAKARERYLYEMLKEKISTYKDFDNDNILEA